MCLFGALNLIHHSNRVGKSYVGADNCFVFEQFFMWSVKLCGCPIAAHCTKAFKVKMFVCQYDDNDAKYIIAISINTKFLVNLRQ